LKNLKVKSNFALPYVTPKVENVCQREAAWND